MQMLLLICLSSLALLTAGALDERAAIGWETTPDERRYLLPGISPMLVSYWGVSAKKEGGQTVTGLKVWLSPGSEATDMVDNGDGRHLYFDTTQPRGLTLPVVATVTLDCAYCVKIATLLPLNQLGMTYTKQLGKVKDVVVVAAQSNTQVTVKVAGVTKISQTLGAIEQVSLDESTASSKLLEVTASKPVAVFLQNDLGQYSYGAAQLSPSS